MRYIIDKEKKYFDDIIAMLRAFNTSQTGERKREEHYFYMVIDDQLVGGLKSDLSWDWVGIHDIYYDSLEILKCLVSHVCQFYKEDAVGIKFSSSLDCMNDDLEEIGFKKMKTIKYSPLMREVSYLEMRDLKIYDVPSVEVIISDDRIEVYNEILERENKDLRIKYNVDYKTKDLIVAVLDEDEFIGGLHSVVYEDHMYINLLVVDGAYRGRKIGSELMKRIEAEADENIQTISLGTTQFQAKDFYEKLGYQTVMTQRDLPKGFDCYTLIKFL